MAEFDPYYEWLGIPREEQPPHHYRLLGLPPFESKPELIANAADRQMVYVRTFQTGLHKAHSQLVLNQLAVARGCLLDPAKKKQYDDGLRPFILPDVLGLAPTPTRLIPLPEVLRPETPAPATPTALPAKRDPEPTGEMGSTLPIAIGVGVLGILLFGVVSLMYFGNPGGASPPTTTNPSPSSPVNPAATPGTTVSSTSTSNASGSGATSAATPPRPPSQYLLLTSDELKQLRAGDATKIEIVERSLDADILRELAQISGLTDLRFKKTDLNDSDLAALAALSGLQKLSISYSRITNSGLLQLKPLKQLRCLNLANVAATAQGVAELAKELPELEELRIDTLTIESGAIDLLVRSSHLKLFSAANTNLSDDGLRSLSQMDTLQTVSISSTQVTAAGFAKISQLSRLTTLHADGNVRVNNEAIGYIARCPALQELTLGRTSANGFAVNHLSAMKGLKLLDLSNCNFSATAAADLQSRLPGCEVKPWGKGESVAVTTPVSVDPAPAAAAVEPEPVEQLPSPTQEDQKAAETRVRAAYGEEIEAAKTSAAKIKVSTRLADQVHANREDPPAMFALLRMSAELAAEAGDVQQSFSSVDTMSRQFMIDEIAVKAYLYKKALEATKDAPSRAAIASLGLELADDALDAERYETATQISRQVAALNAKLRDGDIPKQLKAFQERMHEVTKLAEAADDARITLVTNPNNAAAHLALAKYLAFGRGNWEEAREHFAASGDDHWQSLASAEATAGDDPALMATAADAWWDASETAKGAEKQACQERAAHWYQKALPGLSGLDKAKAEKRLMALAGAGLGAVVGGKIRPGAGMVGRILLDNADAGILLVYQPGKTLRSADIAQALGVPPHRLQVTLTGLLQLREDAHVTIWHASGRGGSQLMIDGRLLSAINDVANQRNITPGTQLRKGQHTITWILTGSDLGNSALQPFDRDSGRPLPVSTNKQIIAAATGKNASRRVDLASGVELPKKPATLKD
jgi:hypothetical protein